MVDSRPDDGESVIHIGQIEKRLAFCVGRRDIHTVQSRSEVVENSEQVIIVPNQRIHRCVWDSTRGREIHSRLHAGQMATERKNLRVGADGLSSVAVDGQNDFLRRWIQGWESTVNEPCESN